ncbi:myelin and lymphocyte protein-like [Mantella aurantiaca]
MASNTAAPVYGDTSPLPSGLRTFATFPDLLMILEFVFGGLVWILVASTRIPFGLLQGWVMFVSVFCFVFTTILLILYCIGAHGGKSSWTTIDAFYHFTAALFYLSASVLQAYATILAQLYDFKVYQEDIAAVVFSYIATLLYVIHAVASLFRWKRSP